MLPLPPAGQLALAGMALVAVFGLWKLQVEPRIHRARRGAPNV